MGGAGGRGGLFPGDGDYREELSQMDHVTVDEERGEHMRLVVSRGAFVADESATGGGADGEVRIKYQLQRPKQV